MLRRGRGGSHLRSPQAKGWAQRKVERGCRPSVQRKKGEEADDSEYDVSMAVASQMGRRPRTEKTIDHFEKAPRSPHVRTICARSRHAYKDYGLLREFVLKVAPLTRTPKKTKKKTRGKWNACLTKTGHQPITQTTRVRTSRFETLLGRPKPFYTPATVSRGDWYQP